LDPEVSCIKVFPVRRQIGQTRAVARAALQELLQGPTPAERAAGYYTNINPGVVIQKLSVKNGVARVDFNKTLEYRVGGSCRTGAIIAQITRTLKQFPTVTRVIISINGRTEDILQP
jgi:spore germination protein GerM